MGFRAQRLGFSLSRGWTLLLLAIGGLIAAAFWLGPVRALPADLQLLAVTGDVAQTTIEVDGQLTTENTVRYAIPLAVRNVGAQSAQPWQLNISIPGYYHLTTPRGRLTGEVTAGVPLRRYTIDLPPVVVPVDSATMPLPGLDTIWIEPDLPRYYCVMAENNVPDFEPAPARDPATLSRVGIFYSFRTRDATERHTGLLHAQLDPSMLQSRPAPRPPAFPTVLLDVSELEERDAAQQDADPASAAADSATASDSLAVSDTTALQAAADTTADNRIRLVMTGTRHAFCGDPEAPIELFTMRHETPDGGRVYTIHVAEQPVKRLYDMNNDGIIEMERWDGDGDGLFEAQREARFEVPEFLVPRPPRSPERLEPDTVPPDSAWLRTFANTGAGPFRFSRRAQAEAPVTVPDSLRPDSLRSDSAAFGPGGLPDSLRTGAPVPDTAGPDTTVRDTPPPQPRRQGPLGTPIRLPPDSIRR